MNKYAMIGIIAAVVLILAGIVVLGTMDVPAPSGTVETELDDSRFPR
jgi:hypothetical protein